MFRKFLLILSLMAILPASAGVFEDALKQNENVVLYLYKQQCYACKKFNPVYNKMSKMHDKKYAFIKVSTDEYYGARLAWKMGVRYVPYVLIINSKTKNAVQIPPECLYRSVCVDETITNFKG